MKFMKIDHEEIKTLYEAYIAAKTLKKRKECPSPELIFSLFMPANSDNIRYETLTHVLKCSHCTKDFKFILYTQREEKRFIDDLEEALKPTKKEKRIKSFIFRPSWKNAFILIGAVIIAVVFMLNIPNKHVYRGTNQKSIRLISPLDQHYSKSTLHFEWEMIIEVDYFILEIFNESLYPIWKSEKTIANQMNLPKDALTKLYSGKVYYWVVTAFKPNDRILESQLQKFKISR